MYQYSICNFFIKVFVPNTWEFSVEASQQTLKINETQLDNLLKI